MMNRYAINSYNQVIITIPHENKWLNAALRFKKHYFSLFVFLQSLIFIFKFFCLKKNSLFPTHNILRLKLIQLFLYMQYWLHVSGIQYHVRTYFFLESFSILLPNIMIPFNCFGCFLFNSGFAHKMLVEIPLWIETLYSQQGSHTLAPKCVNHLYPYIERITKKTAQLKQLGCCENLLLATSESPYCLCSTWPRWDGVWVMTPWSKFFYCIFIEDWDVIIVLE